MLELDVCFVTGDLEKKYFDNACFLFCVIVRIRLIICFTFTK